MDPVRTSYSCPCPTVFEAFSSEEFALRVRTEELGDQYCKALPDSKSNDFGFENATEGLVVDIPGTARLAIRAATIASWSSPGGWVFEVYCKEQNVGKRNIATPDFVGPIDMRVHGHVDVDVTLIPYWKRAEDTPAGIDRKEIGKQKVFVNSTNVFLRTQENGREACVIETTSAERQRVGDEVDKDANGLLMGMLEGIASGMAGEKIKKRQLFLRDQFLPAECRAAPDRYGDDD